MSRRALVLSYDGTDFAGWQVQPDRRTVQGDLEAALSRLWERPVRIQGAGRTDAGVHALAQVAHLDDPLGWPAERLAGALNASLAPDLRVRAVHEVADDFHALGDARRKTYVYQCRRVAVAGGRRAVEAAVPPLLRRTHLGVPADLDLGAMRRAAAALVGTHDFVAFSKAMPAGRGTVKRLEALRVLARGPSLALVASGEGFLYGMCRLLAGLLLEVGRGRLEPAAAAELLAARDRERVPASLPARGLLLARVDYPGGRRSTAPCWA